MAEQGADRITWVGHATVLLELGGARLLTDPFVTPLALHLRRHAPPCDPAVLRDLDAVLISHQHLDHLHLPSLRRVARDVPVVVPRGAGGLVAHAGFGDVREVVAGDALRLGPVDVAVVHAEHDDRRRPGAGVAAPVGYVARTAATRVYFPGDTAVFPAMADLAREGVDVALLPIWGWGPKLGPGHMDPEEAARAAALIGPRVVVPIHWGTYFPRGRGRRRAVAFSAPPRRLAAAMQQRAPGVCVVVLAPGEALALGVGAERA